MHPINQDYYQAVIATKERSIAQFAQQQALIRHATAGRQGRRWGFRLGFIAHLLRRKTKTSTQTIPDRAKTVKQKAFESPS